MADLLKCVFIIPKPPKLSAEDQASKKEKAKGKKANLVSFADKSRLGPEYVKKFNGDLDELWKKVDNDGNMLLDKNEAKKFMEELGDIVKPEEKGIYDISNFDKLFKMYDEDTNGFLEKAEMCVFIKKMFKKQKKT